MTDDDGEPTVLLPSGAHVLQAVYELIATLQAAGHVITIERGDVFISPPVRHDCWFVLASNWTDTNAVLEAQAQARLH